MITTNKKIENFIEDRDEWYSDLELKVLDLEKELTEWRESRTRGSADRAGRSAGRARGSADRAQVLIERGMLTGEVTGVFDARTREALTTFQQQQGFQATGTIDTRTVAALGVSNKIKATQSQTTTGQGQAGQQPPAPQGQANAPAQQKEPATTGQAGAT